MSHAPFQSHSETSREAATYIAASVRTQRERVFQYLAMRGAGGATDEEIQTALSMNPNTQRPRRIELVQQGVVTFRANFKRRTMAGRKAQVWIVRNIDA